MAIYAVGDIQGCYEPLVKLLDKVNFDPAQDRLWAAGDLVNRGPKSLETLRFLKSLGKAFTAVLGNHDLHFLALGTGAFTGGKKASLQPLLNAPDCGELCEWLRYFPLLHHEIIETDWGAEEFLMVHAGIAMNWSLPAALSYAGEVEMALQSKQYLVFLAGMYGNEPDTWNPNLKGMDRLRIITNILTRMRFCNEEGRLNLEIKGSIETAPKGYKAWYEYLKLNSDTNLLFGHWAALDGVTTINNIHALDTGCVWGRCLSALRLHDKKIFCIECQ